MILAPEHCGCSYQSPGASVSASPVCNGLLLFMAMVESYIVGRCDIAQPCSRIVGGRVEDEYDFIVVGGGTAGAIVAGRLAENSTLKVLLIEAGGPDPVSSRVPSFYRNFWNNPETDWMYRTVPENYCLAENGRGCMWPRGKTLGGCSVLNGMMYHRGHEADFQDWTNFGAEGWSWEENKPYFDKSEDNKQTGTLVSQLHHATGGPMPVQQFSYTPEVVYDFLQGVKQAGLPVINDMVDPDTPDGLTIAQTFTKHGQRYTTARAYLMSEKERSNLDVLLNAHVSKVLIKKHIARGVEYIKNGRKKTVKATKEVILSAGALNSPHILMLSGIGPRKTLEKFDIPVVADLPVGQNLRNHYGMTLYFTLEKQHNTQVLDWSAATEYLLKRDGPMTSTGITQMTGLLYSSLAERARKQPDLQFFFNGFSAECSQSGEVNEPVGVNYRNGRNISINAVSLLPKSVGYMTLQSAHPLDPPLFYPGYFQHPDDLIMIRDAGRYVKRIVEAQNLKNKYGIKLDKAYSAACNSSEEWSDAWLECMARTYTDAQNHQSGTAAISRVIDDRLRVFDVSGIRVIDASSMPTQITGNPQAAIMMVAERGADMILADWSS
ncbi:unnamed protein product [Plutella xylostella]|nr:unnamed protein product [Plutella xylostella]